MYFCSFFCVYPYTVYTKIILYVYKRIQGRKNIKISEFTLFFLFSFAASEDKIAL